jgi:HupE / UreJ protein
VTLLQALSHTATVPRVGFPLPRWGEGNRSLSTFWKDEEPRRRCQQPSIGATVHGLCRVPTALFLSTWITLLGAVSASAHTTGISYADIDIGERQVDVRLQLNLRELQFAAALDENHDQQIAPEELQSGFRRFVPDLLKQYRIGTDHEEGQGSLVSVSSRPVPGEVECRLSYKFRQPLNEVWVKATLHQLTDSGHWHLAQVRYDGQEEQLTFNLENPAARIELWRGWSSYYKLGLRFLKIAWQNLLASPELAGFLAGLVLVRNQSDGSLSAPLMFLLSQLIAFAVGIRFGSVLPPGFAGAAMALSVVYVAAENLLLKEVTHRGWIAAFFGVIYGFAFAELVQTAGLPPKGMLTALICYQLGVGLVVAGLVALTLLLVEGFKRLPRPRQAVVLASLAFMALGLFQFVRKLS